MTKPTTMRRLPRQARGEQRIAAILQAAAQVFYEVGFDAATTDMIAQCAHTAIGSLYDFFPNKEAIAQRLSEQFCEDLRVLFDGILTDELVQVPLHLVEQPGRRREARGSNDRQWAYPGPQRGSQYRPEIQSDFRKRGSQDSNLESPVLETGALASWATAPRDAMLIQCGRRDLNPHGPKPTRT